MLLCTPGGPGLLPSKESLRSLNMSDRATVASRSRSSSAYASDRANLGRRSRSREVRHYFSSALMFDVYLINGQILFTNHMEAVGYSQTDQDTAASRSIEALTVEIRRDDDFAIPRLARQGSYLGVLVIWLKEWSIDIPPTQMVKVHHLAFPNDLGRSEDISLYRKALERVQRSSRRRRSLRRVLRGSEEREAENLDMLLRRSAGQVGRMRADANDGAGLGAMIMLVDSRQPNPNPTYGPHSIEEPSSSPSPPRRSRRRRGGGAR